MPAPLSLERLRIDVAALLGISPSEIGMDDNLADHGLDSMRLMQLAQRWSADGFDVPFADLAERPQLSHWGTLINVQEGGGPA